MLDANRRRHPLEMLGFSPSTETTILAVIVGILTSFCVILFKKLIMLMQHVFWQAGNMDPVMLMTMPWWRRFLTPAIGGLIVGPIIYFFARETKGHGVPQVMEAVVTKNSIIKPVVALIKTFVSAISISSGGSLGREGPIVQIGAAIGSSLGQVFNLRPAQMKTIVGCGVAAGIGATFNAPIAGTLFALELIVSDFGLTSFTPIIVASVTSTAIIRHFEGNIFEFALPLFKMVSVWELLVYVILGLFAGIVGYAFTKFLYFSEDFFAATKLPEWFRPAMGGAVVGVIALGFPHVMGVGYESVGILFDGRMTLGLMVLLVGLKLFATSVSVGSGGSGGVFSPSLFIGAMLGGAFGTVVNMLFPASTGPVGAYALVGMAAVNGSCTLAPLSAIIILVELTNNYSMILPLMLTVVIATHISRKLSPESIYTTKLARMGIHVHLGEDMNILRAVKVTEVIRHDESVIRENASVEDLITLSLNRRRNVIFVVDENDIYRGIISLQNIKHLIGDTQKHAQGHLPNDLIDYCPALTADQTLDQALTAFGTYGFDRLAVVNADARIRGSVVISDLIEQYNKEVMNRNIAIELGAVIHSHDAVGSLRLDDTHVVSEIPVPAWMDGKRIDETELRKRYGVSIFLVKAAVEGKEQRIVTPSADYVLHTGDSLLVGGDEKDISRISDH